MMGIKHVNHDKFSFATKQFMFGVFAFDEAISGLHFSLDVLPS